MNTQPFYCNSGARRYLREARIAPFKMEYWVEYQSRESESETGYLQVYDKDESLRRALESPNASVGDLSIRINVGLGTIHAKA
jgi:hypothetical protein